MLAPMESHFPAPQDIAKGEDSALRWAVRCNAEGTSGFVFVNNYERLQNLSDKKGVMLEACGVKFPKITVPSGAMCVFPVNVDGIRYATAQLVAKRDGKIYMEQIKGIPTTICVDGKTLKNVKARGVARPVYKNIYLLKSEEAERLFLDEDKVERNVVNVTYEKVKDAEGERSIVKGRAKVAVAPSDEDFERAAVYKIAISDSLKQGRNLLKIDYRGDCARLYSDGKLVADNFYYGRPFMFGLWRLPEGATNLELKVLPMQKDAPIYYPREADRTVGEKVVGMTCEAIR
jgi:hypothetical protein